jgi:hypothetical protein
MITDLPDLLPFTKLISLDHDLEPTEDERDPSDGLMVANFLTTHSPFCPVVIHTSNNLRGDWMEGALDLGKWLTKRILPVGDDWIEVDWFHTVRNLIGSRRLGR